MVNSNSFLYGIRYNGLKLKIVDPHHSLETPFLCHSSFVLFSPFVLSSPFVRLRLIH